MKYSNFTEEEKAHWEDCLLNSVTTEMHFPGDANEFMKERGYTRNEHGDFVAKE